MIKHVLTAAVLCSTVSAFAATNLVVDGSFESVVVAAGNYKDFTGGNLTGWTQIPTLSFFPLIKGGPIEVRNADVGNAQDGHNYVELDSTKNSAMVQYITTKVGAEYTLSFYYSNRTYTAVSTNGIGFAIGDNDPVEAPALAVNNSGGNIWTKYTTTFVADDTSTSIEFFATGTNDSYGTSLDNVSVSAVPEPATLAMMGAGLLGLVGLGRRRNRDL